MFPQHYFDFIFRYISGRQVRKLNCKKLNLRCIKFSDLNIIFFRLFQTRTSLYKYNLISITMNNKIITASREAIVSGIYSFKSLPGPIYKY